MSAKTIRNTKKIKSNKTGVVILATDVDSKITSLGPKTNLPIHNNKSLLETQVKIIRNKFPDSHIVVVAGLDADRVFNKLPTDVSGVENINFKDTSDIKNISIGLRACIADEVLIVPGQLLFNQYYLDYEFEKSGLFVEYGADGDEKLIGCNICQSMIEYTLYTLPNPWRGMMYLKGKELNILKSLVHSHKYDFMMTFELINKIMGSGGKLTYYHNKQAKCKEIITSKDIKDNRDYAV